jgi:acyl phosphate:glycerol-3-phosphate acyltransferase
VLIGTLIGVPLAYLLGSVPVSYLIVRWVGHRDLRAIGSGNLGATNVYRALGLPWAVLAFGGDALKGALPAMLARQGFLLGAEAPSPVWAGWLISLSPVLGHLFPPWFKFRGGKGAATSFGVMLVLAPKAALLALALWMALALALKIVSLASLVAALAQPILVYGLGYSLPTCGLALVLAVLVIISHHENIRRLLRGEEQAPNKNL